MKNIIFIIALMFPLLASAGPVLQMNKAFYTLTQIMPFMLDENQFKEKKNDEIIRKHLSDFQSEFKLAGHDQLLKSDLFAPSYSLMMRNLKDANESFIKNKKSYSNWVLRDSVGACIECHTRLPAEYTSSFQDGDIQIETAKYKDPYELGIIYLIVRRYVDAKNQFQRVIQDKLIKKETTQYIKPLQQILMVETKIMKNPEAMVSIIDQYASKKIAEDEIAEMKGWKTRLMTWKGEKTLKTGIKNEKELQDFMAKRLAPIEEVLMENIYKPDLLLSSGRLSVYFFQNPGSKSAPLLNYWLGKIEGELKRDEFLNSSDLFLKQCIKRYPLNPLAKKCYETLEENIEFMFSGSAGTNIPDDVKEELIELKKLTEKKK